MIIIYDNGGVGRDHEISFVKVDDLNLIPIIEKVCNTTYRFDSIECDWRLSEFQAFIIAIIKSLDWRQQDSLIELHHFICINNFYLQRYNSELNRHQFTIRKDLVEDAEVLKLLRYLLPLWEDEFDETMYEAKEDWDRLYNLRLIAFNEFKNEL